MEGKFDHTLRSLKSPRMFPSKKYSRTEDGRLITSWIKSTSLGVFDWNPSGQRSEVNWRSVNSTIDCSDMPTEEEEETH
jgi:hypothetical protein